MTQINMLALHRSMNIVKCFSDIIAWSSLVGSHKSVFVCSYLCIYVYSVCVVNILLLMLLYALFNHPRLLIQVTRVQKAQFSYRLDGLVP